MSRRGKSKRPARTGSVKRSNPSGASTRETSRSDTVSHKRWISVGVCIFLTAAVWAIFGQTLRYAFLDYDDDDYVYDNPAVSHGLNAKAVLWAFTHIHSANWHPLTTLTHMLDCQVYGLHPWGHHLENVLLHGTAAILLFLLLQQMSGALWRSAFVSAVFAVHPLHVESVAWISERKDVLSGVFFMLTLMAYVGYARTNRSGAAKTLSFVRFPAYWLTLALFAMGLMSKPMLITLPFVLLLLDWWPLQRFTRSIPRSLVAEKIPFLLLSAASCVATIWAQQQALNDLQRLNFPVRVGNAVVSYSMYLWQMLYPVNLAVLYPHPGNRLRFWMVGLSALVLLSISAGILVGRRKHPYFLMGWLWYLGMLVPVIGLVQVGPQARADRYTYLPQIGLYIMVAWGAVDLCSSWRYRRILLGSSAAVIVGSLLVVAHFQTGHWKDTVSLMSHAIACTSNNPVAQGILGNAFVNEGKFPEAIQYLDQSLRGNATSPEAHNNLGLALAHEGKLPEAIQHYERALKLKPNYADAYNNLGSAAAEQGKLPEAIEYYGRALQLKPEYAQAYNNLGLARGLEGNFPEAVQQYERAIQIKPDYPEAQNNLGVALARQGNLPKAIQHYERALQLKPDYPEAHNNLGLALAREGNLPEAIQHYERALQLKPDYVEVLNNLAYMLATSQDPSVRSGARAIALSQRANELTGAENPVILGTLAAAYAEAARYSEAVETVTRAIERARAEGRYELVAALESHLERYRTYAGDGR